MGWQGIKSRCNVWCYEHLGTAVSTKYGANCVDFVVSVVRAGGVSIERKHDYFDSICVAPQNL